MKEQKAIKLRTLLRDFIEEHLTENIQDGTIRQISLGDLLDEIYFVSGQGTDKADSNE